MKTKLTLIFLAVLAPTVCLADEYVSEEVYDAQDGSGYTVYSDSSGLHRSYNQPSYHRPPEPRFYRESNYPSTRDLDRIKEMQAIEHYDRQARMQEDRQQAENEYQERRNNISSITEASFAARNVAQAVQQINNMMKGGSGGNWYPW